MAQAGRKQGGSDLPVSVLDGGGHGQASPPGLQIPQAKGLLAWDHHRELCREAGPLRGEHPPDGPAEGSDPPRSRSSDVCKRPSMPGHASWGLPKDARTQPAHVTQLSAR